MPLTEAELQELKRVFPELDWLSSEGWQDVASFAGWRSWITEEGIRSDIEEGRELYCMLKLRKNRLFVRKDCRRFWGEKNVPNINDPDEETWA